MIDAYEHIESKYLNTEVELGIVLARKCENVLVLLHGYGGSIQEVDKYFPLSYYAEEYSMMIVVPELGNQFYLDHKNIDGQKDYIVSGFLNDELPEFLIKKYRIASRMQLLLGGYSMGGFGSILHGVQQCIQRDIHPSLHRIKYDALISVCGAFVADEIALGSDFVVGTDKKRRFALDLFMIKEGELPIDVLSEDPARNTTAAIQNLTEAQMVELPQIVIVSATMDVWHSTSQKLKRVMEEKRVPFISHEIVGGEHDFPVFDKGFRFAFERIC